MAEENTQIIELKQIPIIEERLRAVRDEIEERTQTAVALVCTEETRKDVKKVRADLTKQFDELEAQRKAIKSQILEPYNQFEAIYKECVADPFRMADAELKDKIDKVESGLKAEKEAKARAYFEELCQASDIGWLKWEKTGIKVSMSTSLSRLKAQTMAFIDQVKQNLTMIDTMNYRDEILVEYKKCLDVSAAVSRVAERKRALEEQEAQEAARREKEAERAARAAQVQAEAEKQRQIEAAAAPAKVGTDQERGRGENATPTPVQNQKVYRSHFTVFGTVEQLRKVKKFLESEGIRYEPRP